MRLAQMKEGTKEHTVLETLIKQVTAAEDIVDALDNKCYLTSDVGQLQMDLQTIDVALTGPLPETIAQSYCKKMCNHALAEQRV